MSRPDLRSFDTDTTGPGAQTGRDRQTAERAESGSPAGREARPSTERTAIEYCVDNDLI
ncbi:hypothetical protein [Rhodoplanes roseus]|uniref:hypothetical protein n=1 Tax=Rhodoplanes roseus TaxID=29409 RepID=UPI001476455F|nr:hypothetical protein [Rhodoplanes roseus]